MNLKNKLTDWIQKFNKKGSTIPAIGKIDLGDFRRLSPFCRDYGYERGGPVDRYYIENFLSSFQNDVKGRVLEIKNNEYTQKYGKTKVAQSDILDIDPQNERATIIADLAKADQIPSNTYDCVILTQVLQLIYDSKAAIETIHRILKPGGVLLITVPGITQIAYRQLGSIWYWSFSEASMKRLLGEAFKEENVKIQVHGNILTATAFLYGMGSSELTQEEFDHTDLDYQVIIAIRVVK